MCINFCIAQINVHMSIHTYILAGGKSTRMGEEKGLVQFHGKPLIQYVIDAALMVCPTIFIVTSNNLYASFGFPLIEDIKKELGPAGAIDTVLQHSNAEKNVVLACDMPFILKDSLNFILNESMASVITVPIYKNYPEALLAVYNTSCKEEWHAQVENGILKLSDLLSHFATNFVDGNKMCESNKNLFKNMNSKEDLVAFE